MTNPKTTPTALPTDVAAYLAHLGTPATPDAAHDLAAHFRAQAEIMKAKAAGLLAAAQDLDDGVAFQVAPITDLPEVPDWAHLGVPPLTIKATRVGLDAFGIDVPVHPIHGLKRGVNARGVFDAVITSAGVDLYWREPLQDNFTVFNLRPKDQAEGEHMAAIFQRVAAALGAAGTMTGEKAVAIANNTSKVPPDRMCSDCGRRPIRAIWSDSLEIVRVHRHEYLCPACAKVARIGLPPGSKAVVIWSGSKIKDAASWFPDMTAEELERLMEDCG